MTRYISHIIQSCSTQNYLCDTGYHRKHTSAKFNLGVSVYACFVLAWYGCTEWHYGRHTHCTRSHDERFLPSKNPAI